MDCYMSIVIYYDIAIHQLVRDTFKSLNLVKTVAPCLHCIPMEATIASFSNLATRGTLNKNAVAMVNLKIVVWKISFSLFQILNIILDQFVDCKLCIVMYYKFTVQKLVQNHI